MTSKRQCYLTPESERIPLVPEQAILGLSNPGGGGDYSGDVNDNGNYIMRPDF